MTRNLQGTTRCIASIALALGLLLGCTAAPDDSDSKPPTSSEAPPNADDTDRVIGDIATGFEVPWSIAFHGETPLVSERDNARILELVPDSGGTFSKRKIARIAEASPGGEGGLLGLAINEDHLYTYFTSSNDNRIVRYELRGEPGSLSLGRAESILTGIPKASNHNGGRIAFGPDQKLYVTTGDASDTDTSQDRNSLAGKILRLEADGAIPKDNPFNNSPVYSYGHRNPQGIAWDSDGTLYSSEFGQNRWDELNVIEPGGNYGWPTVEGIGNRDGFIDPVQQWRTDEASPSGIAIVGDTIFIANLRGQRLTAVSLTELGSSTTQFVNELGRIRDAVAAPDGSLWILTNNTDGRGNPRDGDDRIIRLNVDDE